jgi:hypothetical protein
VDALGVLRDDPARPEDPGAGDEDGQRRGHARAAPGGRQSHDQRQQGHDENTGPIKPTDWASTPVRESLARPSVPLS